MQKRHVSGFGHRWRRSPPRSTVGTLVLQVRHGTPVPLAAFISAALGACVGFTLNKYVAFRDRSSVTASQLGRFGIVAVATALLMAVAMEIVAVKLRVPTAAREVDLLGARVRRVDLSRAAPSRVSQPSAACRSHS